MPNGHQTKTAVSAEQTLEVSLRTMGSDIAAIGTGQMHPKPERVSAPIEERAETQTKIKRRHPLRTVIIVLLLLGIAWAAYTWLYPALQEVISPGVI